MTAVLASVLAFIVGDVLRVRRAHVERAMSRAGIGEPASTARSMYRCLAEGVFELVALAFRPGAGALARVEVPASAIARLLAAGRGAVVATAHTGNWDLSACAVAAVAPLSVVTKSLRVRWLDALWQNTRRRRSVKLLHARDAARPALAALRRGELVAMLVDQAPERHRAVVETRFLGSPAWVDLAPALVAMRARVPLVVAFPRRGARGFHSIDVVAALEPPLKPSRAWAKDAMIEVTGRLEEFVRRHPAQWLWMHRRWKPLPETAEPKGGVAHLAGESP